MKNIIPFCVIFIGFVAALTIYLLASGLIAVPMPQTREHIMEMSGAEIAESSAAFLDAMRREDEQYFYAVDCDENANQKDCVLVAFYPNDTNGWPLIAYSGLYEATGNNAYLQKARTDSQILFRKCSIRPEICLWTLVQIMEYQRVTGDQDFAQLISSLGPNLLAESEKNSTMLLGIEARELAMLYQLSGREEYLNEAKQRLQESKNLWQENGPDKYQTSLYAVDGFKFYSHSCWTELAEIQIYEASRDQTYLQNAVRFFDSAKVDNYARKIEQLVALQPCIEALLKLAAITGNEKYRTQAISVSQYIVTYRWDPDIPIAMKYNGDGGYMNKVYSFHNAKILPDASYMIYLLTRMKDVQFEILPWR